MTKSNSPLIGRKSSKSKTKQSAPSGLTISSLLENSQLDSVNLSCAQVRGKEAELDDWSDKIFTIAILLTGCADDAQQVVDEVMLALQTEASEPNETLETRVHRLAYDSSLVKLLGQVDRKTSKLEEASKNILTASNFLS